MGTTGIDGRRSEVGDVGGMRSSGRGSALIVVVLLVFFASVIATVLFNVPYYGYQRQAALEEKEGAIQAADAGVKDAIVRLVSTEFSPTAATTVASRASPRPFGPAGLKTSTGFHYAITPTSNSVVKIVAEGVVETTMTRATTTTLTSQVEAYVKINTAPPLDSDAFAGALMVSGTGDIKTGVFLGSHGNVDGTDVQDGTDVRKGITFSKTFGNIDFRYGQSSGGSAGDIIGGQDNDSDMSAMDALFQVLDGITATGTNMGNSVGNNVTTWRASQPQPLRTNYVSIGNSDIGAADAPVVLVIKPTSLSDINSRTNGLLDMSSGARIYGMVFIDLSSVVTNDNSSPMGRIDKPIVNYNSTGGVQGMVVIKGPPGTVYFDDSEIISMKSGQSGLMGSTVIKFQGSAIGHHGLGGTPADRVPLVVASANADVQFHSGNVDSAINAATAVTSVVFAGSYTTLSYRVIR